MLLAALFVCAHDGQRDLAVWFGEEEPLAFLGKRGSAAQQAHEMEFAYEFVLLAQAVLHRIERKADELELVLHVVACWGKLGDDVLKRLVDASCQV